MEEIGSIKYYAWLEAISKKDVLFTMECPFSVIVPINLNETDEALQFTEIRKQCDFARGTVTATVSLKKKSFSPGELIDGIIHISNNRKESINTAFLRIFLNTKKVPKNLAEQVVVSPFEYSGVNLLENKILPGEIYPCRFYYSFLDLVPYFFIA